MSIEKKMSQWYQKREGIVMIFPYENIATYRICRK